jgi:hypothetical protein
MNTSWIAGTLLLTAFVVRETPSNLPPGPLAPAVALAAEADARAVQRAALARARRERSLDGVLSAAEALAALGDREGVERALRTAEALAGGDPEARADVRATAARIAPDILPVAD